MIEFYTTLIEHLGFFVILSASILGFLYFIFRRHIFSIFDPLLYYVLITEAFCITDVVFMGYYKLIQTKYTVQYLLSESALFLGILLFRVRVPLPLTGNNIQRDYIPYYFYRLALILFVGLNVFVYTVGGIPLFVENRLEIFRVGGGFGLISRMFDVLIVIIIYYLLEVHRLRSWRWREWVVLGLIATIQVLSGAKSAALTLVFIVSLHAFYTGGFGTGELRSIKLLRQLTIAAVGGFLVVAQVQLSEVAISGQSLSLISQAALRFVNNGDAFVYAYAENLIERLNGSNSIRALFSEYLAFFRFAAPDELPTHLGRQLSQSLNGFDATTQTNAKHNIFGYVYFGVFGGVVYSFMLGVAIGFLRYKILGLNRRSWQFGIAYIVLNLGILTAVSDFDNSSRAILNVTFIFIPLVVMFSFKRYGSYRHVTVTLTK